MKDKIYQRFAERWRETVDMPPQQVGFLTPLYKRVTKQLKVMPWIPFLMGSLIVVLGIYYVLGSSIASWVSILQRGF